MKLWAVTDHELVTTYWTDYKTAGANYRSCVEDAQGEPNATVSLALVTVPVTADVVLRLLNGRGGYESTTRIIEEWKSDE